MFFGSELITKRILINIPETDEMLKICKISKEMKQLTESNHLWQLRIEYQFPALYDYIYNRWLKIKDLNWKDYYFIIESVSNYFCKITDEEDLRFIHLNKLAFILRSKKFDNKFIIDKEFLNLFPTSFFNDDLELLINIVNENISAFIPRHSLYIDFIEHFSTPKFYAKIISLRHTNYEIYHLYLNYCPSKSDLQNLEFVQTITKNKLDPPLGDFLMISIINNMFLTADFTLKVQSERTEELKKTLLNSLKSTTSYRGDQLNNIINYIISKNIEIDFNEILPTLTQFRQLCETTKTQETQLLLIKYYNFYNYGIITHIIDKFIKKGIIPPENVLLDVVNIDTGTEKSRNFFNYTRVLLKKFYPKSI